MSMLTAITVEEIRQRGSIRDRDVARMREAYADGAAITDGDADALIALHAATTIQDQEWARFLVEVIADYIVDQAPPEGYVVAENARWLKERISAFGRIETSTEMALLVHVLETARWAPPSLAAFGLDQIRHAVETGTGPLRAGRETAPGAITPEDVELAARIIGAFGADPSIPVTRAEADALIGINRAIAEGCSSPAWSLLLVRTVGAAILASLDHAVPARGEVVDAALPHEDAPELVAMLMGNLSSAIGAASGLGQSQGALRIWRSSRILSPEERALARLARQRLEIVTNEVIEEANDEWLVTRLSERPAPDANEQALLAYVVREASRITPGLAQFAAAHAIAA